MDIGETEMENNESDKMNTTDVSMLIAGIAAALATIIYSLKHIKKSTCCGSSCTQVVVDAPQVHEESTPSTLSDLMETLDIAGVLDHNILHHTDV